MNRINQVISRGACAIHVRVPSLPAKDSEPCAPIQSVSELRCSLVWKLNTDKCVDASAVIVNVRCCIGLAVYHVMRQSHSMCMSVFFSENVVALIGSHSHWFYCISVHDGTVQWQVKLADRIEATAAVIVDLCQAVVGM